MTSVFKGGYLQVINPNYCGLVGWECEIVYASHWNDNALVTGEGLILALSDYHGSGADHNFIRKDQCRSIQSFKIPQFTPADIPVGELVWAKEICNEEWVLLPLRDVVFTYYYNRVVPYIIAETAEEAEKYKDWNKES